MRWRFWRQKPKTGLVQKIRTNIIAAVTMKFVAQAEEDFGPDWREHMRGMTQLQRDRWINKYFSNDLI